MMLTDENDHLYKKILQSIQFIKGDNYKKSPQKENYGCLLIHNLCISNVQCIDWQKLYLKSDYIRNVVSLLLNFINCCSQKNLQRGQGHILQHNRIAELKLP